VSLHCSYAQTGLRIGQHACAYVIRAATDVDTVIRSITRLTCCIPGWYGGRGPNPGPRPAFCISLEALLEQCLSVKLSNARTGSLAEPYVKALAKFADNHCCGLPHRVHSVYLFAPCLASSHQLVHLSSGINPAAGYIS